MAKYGISKTFNENTNHTFVTFKVGLPNLT